MSFLNGVYAFGTRFQSQFFFSASTKLNAEQNLFKDVTDRTAEGGRLLHCTITKGKNEYL